MALTARHQWMSEKVAQAFGLDVEEVKSFVSKNKASIDPFLSPESAPKLFVFYQPRTKRGMHA